MLLEEITNPEITHIDGFTAFNPHKLIGTALCSSVIGDDRGGSLGYPRWERVVREAMPSWPLRNRPASSASAADETIVGMMVLAMSVAPLTGILRGSLWPVR